MADFKSLEAKKLRLSQASLAARPAPGNGRLFSI